MEKGLRIVKLVAENVKGLKAVEIVPDEHFQVIAGRNGQGKSSVLDAIWLALGGGAASKGVIQPVREGADSAMAQLDLGDYIVTRKWTSNDKSTLTVTSAEGAKFSSPQKMLDELIGRLSFDPLAFSNLDDKKQLETLMSLVELPVDPMVLEAQKKNLFDERTAINREVKNLKAQLDSLVFYPEVPEVEVQMSDVLKELSDAQETIDYNEQKRNDARAAHHNFVNLRNSLQAMDDSIAQMEKALNEAKSNRERLFQQAKEASEWSGQLGKQANMLIDPDLNEIRNKLEEVEQINMLVRNNKIKREKEAAYNDAVATSNSYSAALEAVEAQKQQLIKDANFPIDGLSFDDNGVLYNGVPFKQCSAAERLKVSMAMAMALNPKLRVIRILDGSLLDSTNMNLIQEMVKEKDYQVWIEVVDESGKVGVTIEGGEVKG